VTRPGRCASQVDFVALSASERRPPGGADGPGERGAGEGIADDCGIVCDGAGARGAGALADQIRKTVGCCDESTCEWL